MVVVPMRKDWARHLQEFWNLTASPQLTIFTERYGTLWFIRRTRSRMKRRPNWSIVSLARTAPAHMLERQAGKSFWGSRNTRKNWTLSQLVHRPEPPGQGRPCRGREPCHRLGHGKSGRQRSTATDQMDKKRHFGSGRHRCAWIGMQDPINSATHGTRWFPGHVLHRAVNNQDVIKMSDGHRNIVIR